MTNEFAIKVLTELRGYGDKFANIGFDRKEALDMAIKALEQQPKRGHWIKVTNGRGGHECDLCHEYAPSYQSGDEYLTKYCPNCGAKMEVEE